MMFISRFNKLIRNKFLWGAFAVIVILSFVAWGTQTGGRSSNEEAAGKLDGKPVTADEFRKEYFNTYLSMSLMFGQPLKMTDKMNELLRKLTWRRIIVLRTANKLGLTVPGNEVEGTIEQQPFFIEKGQFSRERYQAFVQTFLAKLGASEIQFEDQVREELLINKARMLLAQAVWVAPAEIAQVFSQIYDTFVVSYVFVGKDDLRHKIKISEAEARRYFAAHSDDFKIPETVRVKYAAFPFAQFVDESGLTDEILRSYYDEHIEEFSTKTTNGWSNPVPFEKIEDEIRAKLALENAISTADDKALDFEVSLAPDRAGKAPSFEEAAKAIGVAVQISPFFSLEGTVTGLDVGPDFNQAAFSLRPTPEDYFSHPIKGSNAYYIAAFEQRDEARIPDFAEVKNDVFAKAGEQVLDDELDKVGSELHNLAAVAIKKGKSLDNALKHYAVEVVTPDPFSAKSGLPIDDEDLAYTLLKTALTLNAGELSEAIPTQNGVVLLYVKSRQPAESAVFQAVRNDLGLYIKRKRAEMAFYEWQEYLLKQAGFEDHVLQKREKQPPEDEPEDDSEI